MMIFPLLMALLVNTKSLNKKENEATLISDSEVNLNDGLTAFRPEYVENGAFSLHDIEYCCGFKLLEEFVDSIYEMSWNTQIPENFGESNLLITLHQPFNPEIFNLCQTICQDCFNKLQISYFLRSLVENNDVAYVTVDNTGIDFEEIPNILCTMQNGNISKVIVAIEAETSEAFIISVGDKENFADVMFLNVFRSQRMRGCYTLDHIKPRRDFIKIASYKALNNVKIVNDMLIIPNMRVE